MYFCGTKKGQKIIQWKRNQIIAQLQKIVPIKAACCPLYGVRAAGRFQRAPFFLETLLLTNKNL